MKQKLIAIIQKHTTPQTASLAPMLLMGLAAMTEEDVKELVAWMRSLLAGLED